MLHNSLQSYKTNDLCNSKTDICHTKTGVFKAQTNICNSNADFGGIVDEHCLNVLFKRSYLRDKLSQFGL